MFGSSTRLLRLIFDSILFWLRQAAFDILPRHFAYLPAISFFHLFVLQVCCCKLPSCFFPLVIAALKFLLSFSILHITLSAYQSYSWFDSFGLSAFCPGLP